MQEEAKTTPEQCDAGFRRCFSENARQVVDNGIEHSGQYAGLYRQMAAELSSLTKTNQSAHAKQTPDSK
jgi:hypothetical protein